MKYLGTDKIATLPSIRPLTAMHHPGLIEIRDDEIKWPFDGEYWRDELGFYRQQVTSRCGR